ncbi:MAG: cupin domain-containing protein [Nitrospinota bacterium]|jgi:quercetin dioxygenase-like cupin family protein|nr:cupin domain-containing protein [Nitrospinota bacterium]
MRGEDEIEWLPAALHRQLVQKELLSPAEAGELNLQLWKILRERTEPGGTVLPHTHDTAEIIHFTRGEVRALLSEERTDCGPGDTLIVPAGAIHGVSNTAAGPSEQISLHPRKRKREFRAHRT